VGWTTLLGIYRNFYKYHYIPDARCSSIARRLAVDDIAFERFPDTEVLFVEGESHTVVVRIDGDIV